eukprot:4760677-Ditylum_brightwellii.AAC.1
MKLSNLDLPEQVQNKANQKIYLVLHKIYFPLHKTLEMSLNILTMLSSSLNATCQTCKSTGEIKTAPCHHCQ